MSTQRRLIGGPLTVGRATTLAPLPPEAMFEAVFTLSIAPVLVLDDEARFRAVSRAASEILGYDRNALVGRRLDEFLPGESGGVFRSCWPGVIETAETGLHEMEFIRADGKLCRVTASATSNVVPGLHLLTFDVKPEHQLAEHDPDRFFASSPALLAVVGIDGSFTRVNIACERAFGASEAELGSQSYMDRTHPADRPALDAALSRLRDGEESCTVTLRMRSAYGIYRAIAWEMSRVPGQDALAAAGRMLPISEFDDDLGGLDLAAERSREAGHDVVAPPALEWVAVSAYSGIEPNLALEIERQMMILDDVTRRTPEPRAAAIRCALALRQSLAEMGTIVLELQRRPAHVVPANMGGLVEGHSDPAAMSEGPDALTVRQREVLRLVARGEDNRTISRELFLAEVTVKKHVHQIMLKLGVVNRTQAAIMAYRLGLDVA